MVSCSSLHKTMQICQTMIILFNAFFFVIVLCHVIGFWHQSVECRYRHLLKMWHSDICNCEWSAFWADWEIRRRHLLCSASRVEFSVKGSDSYEVIQLLGIMRVVLLRTLTTEFGSTCLLFAAAAWGASFVRRYTCIISSVEESVVTFTGC